MRKGAQSAESYQVRKAGQACGKRFEVRKGPNVRKEAEVAEMSSAERSYSMAAARRTRLWTVATRNSGTLAKDSAKGIKTSNHCRCHV